MIKVHWVPHSHLDAGWLRSYDYYYQYKVKDVFNSAITSLLEVSSRTYTVGDLAFFSRFFDEQTDERKDQIRALVVAG